LVSQGANPNARDAGPASALKLSGFMVKDNSILHCCVLHGREAMFRHLTGSHQANPWVVNDRGDTALLLAAACRSRKMAQVAIDGTKQVLWTFGPVRCVRYPLYGVEGDQHWGRDRRRTVLQVIDEVQAHELLYADVIWSLLNDKWAAFGRKIFFWFVFLNVISLVSLTLSLCTYVESESCDGVLLLIWLPVPLNGMSSVVGDAAYLLSLMIAMWLLLRLVVTQLRLSKKLHRESVEIVSCLLPWLALPLRFLDGTLKVHRVMLGFASALGWMRFLEDSFKWSRWMAAPSAKSRCRPSSRVAISARAQPVRSANLLRGSLSRAAALWGPWSSW
jgi:hypothetical protein